MVVVVAACVAALENKYTEEANTGSLKRLEPPFRMGKLNMLWEKAVKVGLSLITGACV